MRPKQKGSHPAGVSWPSSMSPVVIKLLLGGLDESGHRRITGLLWNVIITANQVVLEKNAQVVQEKNAQYMD